VKKTNFDIGGEIWRSSKKISTQHSTRTPHKQKSSSVS